jgi:hypothetical protein
MSKTLQQEITNGITQKFKDAVIKKIDKDNYLDIHLPSVNPKKGTHLGINTAKGEIKIVFYCREDDFNNYEIINSKKLEKYAQGIRIKGNPAFNDVSNAVEAAIDFIFELKRVSGNASKNEIPHFKANAVQSSTTKKTSMNTSKELIEFVDSLITNLDPTPININDDFPLRWESNIFIEDYDFSENYLDLDQDEERSNGKYLKSVGTAIEIEKNEDGSFEFWDGIFMIETHAWCSKLNTNQDLPSFSLINQKFRNLDELKDFLVETYS